MAPAQVIAQVAGAAALVFGVMASAEEPPDRIFLNGNVYTVDDSFSTAEAIAVSGNRFTAVGSNEEISNLAGSETIVVDLEGLTVVPGLTDNHFHGAGGGPGVDLSQARSLNDVIDAIRERAEATPPGTIIMTNSNWHEAQLKEERLPFRRDLDKATTEHPVVVIRGGHTTILNTAGLEKWNITPETQAPQGGTISRYPDGSLNGELLDNAEYLVDLPEQPEPSLEERIQQTIIDHNRLHAAGLTAIRHPGGSIEHYRMLEEMKRRGLLTMRVTQLLSVPRRGDPKMIEEMIKAWGVDSDEGDAMLQIGGIKLGVDGGFEGGYMRDPYAEPFDKDGTFYGLQTVSQERYNEIAKTINALGWRVFTHAVGDAAIDQVLAGYKEAHQEDPISGERWGIEHGFIPRDDQFPAMKEMDLYISAQSHLYIAGPSLVKYWGKDRAAYTTPVAKYLEAGIPVSGGSDSPVIPFNPIWVMYHFHTRDLFSGGNLGRQHGISREDALRLITRNHWYLTFEEDTKGVIAPGRYADMVVLEDDLMTISESRLEDLEVVLTMVDGKIVYQSGRSGIQAD